MNLRTMIIYILLLIIIISSFMYSAYFTDEIINYISTFFKLEKKPINKHLIILMIYTIIGGISYLIISKNKKKSNIYGASTIKLITELILKLIYFISMFYIAISLYFSIILCLK